MQKILKIIWQEKLQTASTSFVKMYYSRLAVGNGKKVQATVLQFSKEVGGQKYFRKVFELLSNYLLQISLHM